MWDEFSLYGDVALERTGAKLTRYIYGGPQLIAQERSGVSSYYLPDTQGSTRVLTNASGQVTDTFRYLAFGTVETRTGTTAATYLYTGQQFDPLTELYSLRARYYDPNDGRFLSRDTWAYNYQNPVEFNRYGYTANNPATYVDPSGHTFVERVLKWAKTGVAKLWKQAALNKEATIAGALSGLAGYIAGTAVAVLGDPQITVRRYDAIIVRLLHNWTDVTMMMIIGGLLAVADNWVAKVMPYRSIGEGLLRAWLDTAVTMLGRVTLHFHTGLILNSIGNLVLGFLNALGVGHLQAYFKEALSDVAIGLVAALAAGAANVVANGVDQLILANMPSRIFMGEFKLYVNVVVATGLNGVISYYQGKADSRNEI